MRQDRSTLLISASNQTIRPASPGLTGESERVVAEGTGQEVHAEVGAAAAPEQVLHLLLGFAQPEDRVQPDGDQPGHAESEAASEFAAHHLGDQGLAALSRGPELHDVHPEVVGFDEPRQRAPLTQGRDVAGRGDFLEHRPRLLGTGGRPGLRPTAGGQPWHRALSAPGARIRCPSERPPSRGRTP
ncbi:hypothetical protein GCM10017687_84190 [Streptomyces echinatus]